MSQAKVCVLRAAGTNCDRETAYAFERVGAKATPHHVNELLNDPAKLHDYNILVIPGGFSYGDDVAAGRILATELKTTLLPSLNAFVDGGGLVLGICNGFQVLVNTGLLPGTLTHNESHRYMDRWVELTVETDRCPFVRAGEKYFVPIAHAEGKYVADENTLNRIEEAGQVVLQVRREPQRIDARHRRRLRHNGRVLGLMPHPERHMDPWHHPFWTRVGLKQEADGLRMFQNAVESFA